MKTNSIVVIPRVEDYKSKTKRERTLRSKTKKESLSTEESLNQIDLPKPQLKEIFKSSGIPSEITSKIAKNRCPANPDFKEPLKFGLTPVDSKEAQLITQFETTDKEEEKGQLDFLDDLLGETGRNGDSKSRSKPQIHRNVEFLLKHLYEDQELTVITEKTSGRTTELTITNRPRNASGASRTSSGKQRDSALNSSQALVWGEKSVSQKSVHKSHKDQKTTKLEKLKAENKKKNFFDKKPNGIELYSFSSENLQGTKSDICFQKRKKLKKIVPFKTRSLSNSGIVNSTSGISNNLNKKKQQTNIHLKTTKRKKEQLHSKVTKTEIEALLSKLNANLFLVKSKKNLRELKGLPSSPFPPFYLINILEDLNQKTKVCENKKFVSKIFFKLDCGLFYRGSLSFGKLHGIGQLLLDLRQSRPKEKNNDIWKILFEGEFVESEVKGRGTLFYKKGECFKGIFKKGRAHGNGVLFGKHEEILVSGCWNNGFLPKKLCHL